MPFLIMILSDIAGLGLHLYTVYYAYEASGGIAAFITFFVPIISQIYWLYEHYEVTGILLNDFTIVSLVVLNLFIFRVLIDIFGGKISDQEIEAPASISISESDLIRMKSDLIRMTKKEIQEWAAERGIKISLRLKKDQMISSILSKLSD